MDQTKHNQNKKSLTHELFMNAQFLKRVITKLLLSLSVFSLLFSHSPWIYDLLLNFNFFSSLPIKLVRHTVDKNYIFLLCNGLLVFLAKYSGLLSSSSSSSKHENNVLNEYYSYKSFQDYSRPEKAVMMEQDHGQVSLLEKEEGEGDHQSSNTQKEHKHIEQVITIDEQESGIDHHQQKKFMVEEDHKLQGDQEEQEEKQAFVEEVEDEELNEEQAGWMFCDGIEEKEEDEERGENGRLSTEELNKKFDEFIRKMKEELRIEAQRQVVMV